MYSFRTLLIAFLIVVAMILVGGYFAYEAQLNSIIKDSYHDLEAIKNLKVKQITDWRKERIEDAQSILTNPLITDELQSYLKNRDDENYTKILKWFKLLEKSFSYKEILLLDKNFNSVLSSNIKSSYTKEHLSWYMDKEGNNGVYISPIHYDDLAHLHYSIKINLSNSGQITGYLIIVIDPHNFLYPLIQEWPTPSKTAETLLVRAEGDSLLFLNELRHAHNTALKLKLPLTRDKLPATAAVEGYEGMFRGYDYRGVKVLSAVGPVPGTDWFIISKIDEAEILEKPVRYLIYGIIIIVLLIILSYILFLYIWRISKTHSLNNELELKKEKLRVTNLYATLSQINQAIVREQSRSELVLKIPHMPVKYGNFAACALALRDENDDKIKVEAFSGKVGYFHTILNDDSTYKINDLGFISIQEGLTIVYNNLENDEKDSWINDAYAAGIKSCAASPITFHSKTIGSLVLYSSEETSFGEPERKLLEEIVSDISFSLEAIDQNEKHLLIEKKIQENERKLATLFKNLPGIAYKCLMDEDWTMLFMSEGSKDITGFTPEDLVEQKVTTFGDLILAEDRKYVWDTIHKAVNNQAPFTLIYRIIDREEKLHWVWERGLSILDDDREEVTLEGFISDITELKIAQERLEKSEEYFRYLFHNNPLPMWIIDKESYQFLDINEAAILTYGYSRDEFSKMNLSNIISEEDIKKIRKDYKQADFRISNSRECIQELKNGETINGLIISHEIEFDNKHAVLASSIDITERKIAEEALIEAKEKAEAGEKLKTDFLAQMSHEIRTPVNVILSFSSLIKEEVYSKVNEDLQSSFSSIDHAGRRLIRTIDSILNMAQITSGMFEFNHNKLNIYSNVLSPLYSEFKSLASNKNLEFTLDNKCSKNTLVIADQYSLSQLFVNLIDNAIKYTEKGFVKVKVECDEKNILVSVQDSGIGISKQYLPNLFSAFSQEETGYSRKYEGTGLGLALVNSYCKMNNAEITVNSVKHKGTTFTVTLKKN